MFVITVGTLERHKLKIVKRPLLFQFIMCCAILINEVNSYSAVFLFCFLQLNDLKSVEKRAKRTV